MDGPDRRAEGEATRRMRRVPKCPSGALSDVTGVFNPPGGVLKALLELLEPQVGGGAPA